MIDGGVSASGRRGPATFLACAALAFASLAGCGDDDDEAGGGTATAPDSAGSATAAATDEVEMIDFRFEPAAITIEAGAEVSWANADRAAHTASGDNGSFDTGALDQGDVGRVTFDEPGTYAYVCEFHPFMKGTVEVE